MRPIIPSNGLTRGLPPKTILFLAWTPQRPQGSTLSLDRKLTEPNTLKAQRTKNKFQVQRVKNRNNAS